MLRRLNSQQGMSIIEVLVAMMIILMSAVALGAVLGGAAEISTQAKERQRAISLARGQLDRLRSLDYRQVGLFSPDADPARNVADWKQLCPLAGGCEDTNTQLVTLTDHRLIAHPPTPLDTESATETRKAQDPRLAKFSETANVPAQAVASTYTRNGITLYTYIYWGGERYDDADGNPATPKTLVFEPRLKQWKVAVVVARYRAPTAGMLNADGTLNDLGVKSTTVKLTQVISDSPGLSGIEAP